jgi:hypothetical protein
VNPDELIDAVIGLFAKPGFPVVLSYDDTAEVRIGIAAGEGEEVMRFAQPGDAIVGTISAHVAFPLTVMQNVIGMTPIGFVPKGLIRDAYRELTRRECNRRAYLVAMEQAEASVRASQELAAWEAEQPDDTDTGREDDAMSYGSLDE